MPKMMPMSPGFHPGDVVLALIALASAVWLATLLSMRGFSPLALVLLLSWIPIAAIAYRWGRSARPHDAPAVDDDAARQDTLAALLSESQTARGVAEFVLVQAISRLGAQTGMFGLLHEETASVELVTLGYPEEIAASLNQVPVTSDLPVVRAITGEDPIRIIRSLGEARDAPPAPWVPARTHVAVQVGSGAWRLGAFVCSFTSARAFGSSDVAFLQRLAREGADALRRARSREVERRAILQAEQANARLEFLANASSALSTSVDLQAVAEKIAHLAIGALGDECIVYLVGDDGRIARLASAHRDPVLDALLVDLHERFPLDLTWQKHPVVRTIQLGRPVLMACVDPDLADQIDPRPEFSVLARRLIPRSAMIVPLMEGGKAYGALGFGWFAGGRLYERTDLALAESLAGRVTQFIQTSRVYERERARLVAGIQKAKQEAEIATARERFQRTLLDAVSHDLKTPLTSIMGSLSALREAEALKTRPEVRELSELAYAEARRLVRFVTDILQMTRLEEGSTRVKREPSDVLEIIQAAVSGLGDTLEGRRLKVETGDATPLVPADPVLLVHVFTNLIDNAVKYSPPGSPIDVRIAARAGDMVVSVADRGPGLPGDDLSGIFDRPHRRAAAETGAPSGGAGMALAIAKNIIEAHAGRVWAERRQGGGTVISVALPLH